MNFRNTFFIVFALLVGYPNHLATAQQVHPLARFLDTNTIAFARLDLETFVPQAIYDEFLPVIKPYDRLLARVDFVNTTSTELRSKLLAAGVNEVYGFLSLSDLNSGPFYVVPCGENETEDVKNILEALVTQSKPLIPNHSVSTIPEGILIASKHTAQRLEARFLPVRKDASEVLNLATQSFDIVLAPSQDHLKAIRESIGAPFPKVAGKIFTEGGVNGDLIADGMQKTILSFDATSMNTELRVLGVTSVPAGQDERLGAAAVLADKVQWALDQMRGGTIPYWPRARRMGALPKELKTALRKVKIARADSGNHFTISIDRSTMTDLTRGVATWKADEVGLSSVAFNRYAGRQILLAMHNFESAYGIIPPQNIVDDEGNVLLSWRVALLPFISKEGGDLYNKFRLDEPWDSDHNKNLALEIPEIFQTDVELTQAGKTVWTIPRGDQFMGNCKKFREVTDGASNTILLIQASSDHAVVWTQPTDLAPDLDDLKKGLFSESREFTTIGFADGSVKHLPREISNEDLMAFLTFAGGEIVDD